MVANLPLHSISGGTRNAALAAISAAAATSSSSSSSSANPNRTSRRNSNLSIHSNPLPISRSNSQPESSRSTSQFSSNSSQKHSSRKCNLAPSTRSFSTSAINRASKDPYATLGVKKDAKPKEIKGAYYDLAKKFHPDTNKDKGAKERFVEIQSAYDILSDDKKKAAYDQYGTTDGSSGFDPFGGAGGGSPFGAGSPFGGFGGFGGMGGGMGSGRSGGGSTIFDDLFGAFGGGGPGGGSGAGFAGPSRGDDVEVGVSLSFEEACRGASRTVVTTPIETCKPCSGNGMKKGAKKSRCQQCGGTGTRTFVIQSGFQMASTCPACSGTGETVAPGDACGECEGVGRVRNRRSTEVRIPAGVDDGAKVRLDGLGDAPLSGNGPAGSLYVRVSVKPSKIWRRQGANLHFAARVPAHTAILGGKVRVPTLDGDVDVRVPAGTQVGEEMLLRGRGVPNLTRRGKDKGDLLVQFDVVMPRSLTKRQKELLQAYADDLEGRTPPPTPTPTPTPKPSTPSPTPTSTPASSSSTSDSTSNASTTNSPTSKPTPSASEGKTSDSSTSSTQGESQEQKETKESASSSSNSSEGKSWFGWALDKMKGH